MPVTLQQPLQPVSTLYFPDLTLAIIVRNKILGLHQGLVRSSSSIFRDMLSLPQPHSNEDGYLAPYSAALQQLDISPNRVARVVLEREKEEDVAAYFRAVYERDLQLPPCNPGNWTAYTEIDVPELAGVLRLACLFQDERVKLWASRVLGHVFTIHPSPERRRAQLFDDPADLIALYHLHPDAASALDGLDDGERTKGYFAAIAAARRGDMPWLLPVAYWRLTALSREEVEAREDFLEMPAETRAWFRECHARALQEGATILDAKRVVVADHRVRNDMQMGMFRRMMDIFGCLPEGRLGQLRVAYVKAAKAKIGDGSNMYLKKSASATQFS